MTRPLRIAQVTPPLERVPPGGYGGTERIIHELVVELGRRGHQVTTFASGDSEVPGRLIETVPLALRPTGFRGDPMPWFISTMRAVIAMADEFDIIHSHLEWSSLLLADVLAVPLAATFHGRLDRPPSDDLLRDPPSGVVAISHSQASAHPHVPWTVIYNGLDLTGSPFREQRGDGLCFIGRVAAEKGIVDAIEIAKRTGRHLRIAAKIGAIGREHDYYEDVFKPALAAAGSDVEFLGEVGQAERDALLADSYASLMPGSWPEPFGLVAIESLACGTPVIARPAGALPEIIRDGVDGFLGADVESMAAAVERVGELDRSEIRRSVLERFSAERMTNDYEALYRNLLADPGSRRGAMDRLTQREDDGASAAPPSNPASVTAG